MQPNLGSFLRPRILTIYSFCLVRNPYLIETPLLASLSHSGFLDAIIWQRDLHYLSRPWVQTTHQSSGLYLSWKTFHELLQQSRAKKAHAYDYRYVLLSLSTVTLRKEHWKFSWIDLKADVKRPGSSPVQYFSLYRFVSKKKLRQRPPYVRIEWKLLASCCVGLLVAVWYLFVVTSHRAWWSKDTLSVWRCPCSS